MIIKRIRWKMLESSLPTLIKISSRRKLRKRKRLVGASLSMMLKSFLRNKILKILSLNLKRTKLMLSSFGSLKKKSSPRSLMSKFLVNSKCSWLRLKKSKNNMRRTWKKKINKRTN